MIANVRFFVIIAFSFLAISSLIAQERVLLHINKEGQQEAIPLRKGERTEDVLSRLDKMTPYATLSGNRDSITNFGPNGATNFIAAHQDVMFQWFDPQANGLVVEFGWKNGIDLGTIKKSTIRAWNGDPRLTSLPPYATSASGSGSYGNMGYYKKSDDGDGLKTPFRDEATDTNFVRGKGDSAKTCFDPLGTETKWLKGGQQFSLVPNAWQSFKLPDFGDSMRFVAHQPFGFTKQNDTKISDIVGAFGDTNMLIGANNVDQYPFHSIKFYEGTPTSNYGWQIRDYEWNMYVIVTYTSVPPPRIINFTRLQTTLKTTPRKVYVKVGPGIASVKLFSKINSGTYTWTDMTPDSGSTYSGMLPGANPGDAVTYYIELTDVEGLLEKTVEVKYYIFKATKSYLFMWNGRGLPGVQYAKYFMLRDSITEKPWYDIWDVKSYGKAEIPDLLLWYNGVVEATGDGGYADLTKFAGTWLATGTPSNPKSWFWSDQDHGFINNYADTTFDDTDPHAKYFGVKALINQDFPGGISYPWQMDYVGGTDAAFGFINTKLAADTVTLWYNPGYEWGFTNWMDEFTPMAGAKSLFKDKKFNTRVTGVRNAAANNSWYTAWLAFDYTSVDFLSDTSKTEANDPKYAWMFYDVSNPAANFIKTTTGVSQQPEALVPGQFSLAQNYPNPFNPLTVISYQLAVSSFVTVRVFDLLGREVATIVNERKPAGNFTVRWDATHFASGVYFYRLQAGAFSETKKLMLLK